MKRSISERLNQIINERGLKQVDILEKSRPYQGKYQINLGKSTLSQYVNGKQSADDKRIFLLAKTLGVSEPWLMGFDVDKDPKKEKVKNIQELQNVIKIPVLGEIAAGEPLSAIENIEEYRYRTTDGLPTGELFYLQAKGDSMMPTIHSGSYVLCRKQEDVENGEIAAILVNGDTEAILKRVRKLDDVIILESINEEYDPYIVNKKNPARIIGRAIEVTSTL